MSKCAPMRWTTSTVPANSQYIYPLDSTYGFTNDMSSTATADRTAGPYRGRWAGKRFKIAVLCTDDAATLYLDYLEADGTWTSNVMTSSTGNCTADTLVTFDLTPDSIDYRVRILAAADNPTTISVTIREVLDAED